LLWYDFINTLSEANFFLIKTNTMEEKYNEPTLNRPEGGRLLDAPLLTIDIAEYIQQLKNEPAWQKNDRNGITLFKTKGMRIVLVIMHDGAEMRPQTIDALVSLHVLDGYLRVTTDEQSAQVETGQILTLHANIYHSVKAVVETTFILTMTNEEYGESVYKYLPV
jgi:quercetin dioxygenase-like cupin family protein